MLLRAAQQKGLQRQAPRVLGRRWNALGGATFVQASWGISLRASARHDGRKRKGLHGSTTRKEAQPGVTAQCHTGAELQQRKAQQAAQASTSARKAKLALLKLALLAGGQLARARERAPSTQQVECYHGNPEGATCEYYGAKHTRFAADPAKESEKCYAAHPVNYT